LLLNSFVAPAKTLALYDVLLLPGDRL